MIGMTLQYEPTHKESTIEQRQRRGRELSGKKRGTIRPLSSLVLFHHIARRRIAFLPSKTNMEKHVEEEENPKEEDDAMSASSTGSYSSSSLSISAASSTSSSSSSSFSSFFIRPRIVHPRPHTTQQSRLKQKCASFDQPAAPQVVVPPRSIKAWPMGRNERDRNRLDMSASTLVSLTPTLSSSEEEADDVYHLNPFRQQQREARKIQRLVLLAKEQRNRAASEFVTTKAITGDENATRAPVFRSYRPQIISPVSMKPILNIPVIMKMDGPVDIDTGSAWVEPEEVEEETSSTSSLFTSRTPISLKREAASFESDETRRVSNKSRKLKWMPPSLTRDLEMVFSAQGISSSPPVEAPTDKIKSFWAKKSTIAALILLVILLVAIISLSIVFVGQKNANQDSEDTNKGVTKGTYSPNSSPSQSVISRTHKPTTFSPTRGQINSSPSPTFAPSVASSRPPSTRPTTAFSDTVWQPSGQAIEGIQARGLLGASLALSRNGQVLAVGSRNSTVGNATQAGHVKVFQWNVSRWTPRGQILVGDSSVAHFGDAVALNAEGTILAVSEPTFGTGSRRRSGKVRMFRWSDARSEWIDIGQIDGLAQNDFFGDSLALSGDGSRLAVGSPHHDSSRGQVRLFDYNGTWQLVASLNGTTINDWFGWDVSLSDDGNFVAIGAPHSENHGGYVRCFQQGVNATTWSQVGSDIVNQEIGGAVSSSDDSFGNSVSVSTWNNEHYVAVGAPFKKSNGVRCGFAAVYRLQEKLTHAVSKQYFSLVGSPILGTAANDQLGFAVQLLNGHLVVGSPGFQREQGQVGFYQWTGTDWDFATPLTSKQSLQQADFGYAVGLAQLDNQTFFLAVGSPMAPPSTGGRSSVGAVQVYTTTQGVY